MLAFNEDEAFKIILKKKLAQDTTQNIPDSLEHSSSEISEQDHKMREEEDKDELTNQDKRLEYDGESNHVQSTLGNSLNRRMGWSFDENQQANVEKEDLTIPKETPIEEGSKSLEHSYNALIQSYNMLGGAYVKTPDVKEVWERFEHRDVTNEMPTSSNLSNVSISHVG